MTTLQGGITTSSVSRQDLANISEASYGTDITNNPGAVAIGNAGWTQVGLDGKPTTAFFTDALTGFQGAIYTNGTQVVVSYKGSGPTVDDWVYNNLALFTGQVPPQYYDALSLYYSVANSSQFSGFDITVTGQSKGGYLAELVGASTGAISNTFNTVGIPPNILSQLNIDPNQSFSNITNYNNSTDALHIANIALGLNLLGNSYVIPDNIDSNPIDSHRVFDLKVNNKLGIINLKSLNKKRKFL